MCVGLWNCSGWEAGPVFHRTGNFSSPPSVGLTHPCHIHQLPPALPSWDQSSVGTGRSPQDLHCVHLSSPVPSPQGQGHPGGAARGGPGSAQPGQGPAKPSGDELLGDFSIPSPSSRGSPHSSDPLGGPSSVPPPHLAGGAALGLRWEDPEEVVGGHVEVVVAVGGGEDPDLQGGQTEGAEPALQSSPCMNPQSYSCTFREILG